MKDIVCAPAEYIYATGYIHSGRARLCRVRQPSSSLEIMDQALKTIGQAVRRSKLPIDQQAVGWASSRPEWREPNRDNQLNGSGFPRE